MRRRTSLPPSLPPSLPTYLGVGRHKKDRRRVHQEEGRRPPCPPSLPPSLVPSSFIHQEGELKECQGRDNRTNNIQKQGDEDGREGGGEGEDPKEGGVEGEEGVGGEGLVLVLSEREKVGAVPFGEGPEEEGEGVGGRGVESENTLYF